MMTPATLKSYIDSGSVQSRLSNRLIFLEADPFFEKHMISMIASKMGCKPRHALSYDDISANLESSGLFASSSVYVIRGEQRFLKKPEDFLGAKISSGNFLVIVYQDIDKQSKAAELLDGYICYSPKLSPQQFEAAVNFKHKLPADCCNALAKACNYDTEKAFSELEKMYILSIVDEKELSEVVMDSIKTGFVKGAESSEARELCDYAFEGDISGALIASSMCSKADSDALRVISIVHDRCKGLLQTPTSRAKLSKEEAAAKMELAHSLEMAVKSGEIDEDIAREYAIIELSKKGGSIDGELV